MTTLEKYVAQRFPEHRVRASDVSLTDNTVVAQVKDVGAAQEIANRLRRAFPAARTGLAVVLPNETPVVATDKEDTEGPIDLPRKRIVIAALIVALVLGGASLFITKAVTGEWTGAVISGVFLAIVGGVIGALLGGAGRYAGDRAWQQQRQGDTAIALVVACVNDEATAASAAAALEGLGLIDVRIVGQDGAWHVASS